MTFRKAAFIASAGALLAIPAFAAADMSWQFNTVVTGDTPGGPTPWATLDCVNVSGGAEFTLTFNSFTGDGSTTEFLKQLDLAYNGDLTGATFDDNGNSGITGATFGSFVDAGGSYDAKIDFETSNSSGNRILPGDTVTFDIMGSGVTCENFTTGLLHVNGTPGNEGSGKVAPGPVPEPASMAALGMGALGLLARRRRAKK